MKQLIYNISQNISLRMQNTTLWMMMFAAFAVFTPLLYLIPRQDLFELVDGMMVGVCTGVAIGYAPAAWSALRLPQHELHSADYLVVGVEDVAIMGAFRFAGQWYWRASDKPNWWIDSGFLLLTTVGLVIGFIIIMLTIFSNKGVLIRSVYPRAGVVIGVSAAISSILIFVGWG